jgi:hypothetical protein
VPGRSQNEHGNAARAEALTWGQQGLRLGKRRLRQLVGRTTQRLPVIASGEAATDRFSSYFDNLNEALKQAENIKEKLKSTKR